MDVRALREKLGMTQKELAAKIGASLPSLNRWENGKSEPMPVFRRAMETLERKANKREVS